MKQGWCWCGVLVGWLLLLSSGCTVQQQQQVLGTIGQVIPGSSNSMYSSGSSSSSSSSSQAAASPAPRVDPDRVEAQLVLQTLQRANVQCKPALTAHLIRLQKQAMSTLELPPVYDRYDLKRGKE